MNLMKGDKQQLIALLLLFCAIAILIAIADRAPIHLVNRFPSVLLGLDVTSYLDGVVYKTLPGPYVYRVPIPYFIATVQSLVPTIAAVDIDLYLKIAVLIVCQLSFYIYLRLFFSSFASLEGVFLLDVLLGFTLSSIVGPSILETSDLLNVGIYSLALIAIYRNSMGYLCLLLFVGTLNRETTWLLLPILFVNDFISKKSIYRSAIATSAVAVPYFGLRMVVHTNAPSWFTFEGVSRNIPFLSQEQLLKALVANVHVAVLLGPLLILSFLQFEKRPRFLRIASIITPLFIVIHYVFGTIIEARLWMPLFVILIPLALDTLVSTFSNQPLPNSNISN